MIVLHYPTCRCKGKLITVRLSLFFIGTKTARSVSCYSNQTQKRQETDFVLLGIDDTSHDGVDPNKNEACAKILDHAH